MRIFIRNGRALPFGIQRDALAMPVLFMSISVLNFFYYFFFFPTSSSSFSSMYFIIYSFNSHIPHNTQYIAANVLTNLFECLTCTTNTIAHQVAFMHLLVILKDSAIDEFSLYKLVSYSFISVAWYLM